METQNLRLIKTLGKTNQQTLLKAFEHRNINDAVKHYTGVTKKKYSDEEKQHVYELMRDTYNERVQQSKIQNKQQKKEDQKRESFIEAKNANTEHYQKVNQKKLINQLKQRSEAMSKIKTFIERRRQKLRDIQKLLTIEELLKFVEQWVGDNTKNPFEITLKSGIANIERKFKFMGWDHFYNYWHKVINSGEYIDYDYTKTLKYNATNLKSQNELFDYEYVKDQTNMPNHNLKLIGKNPITNYFKRNDINDINKRNLDKLKRDPVYIEREELADAYGDDIREFRKKILQKELRKTVLKDCGMKNMFDLVLVKDIRFVTGGCNKDTKCCERNIKSVHYEYKVFNPIGKNNNCLFKCLEKILGNNLNIKQLRKDFDIPTDTHIGVIDAYKIIRSITDKPIYIIDWEQNDELDKDNIYILLKNEHYFVVEEFKEIISKDKKTKRGLLTFDFETRKTSDYYLIKASNTKSYLLKDSICCIYYKEYNGGKNNNGIQKDAFVTDDKKTSARKFIDWLNEEAKRKKSYNIIAHNGGNFDFYFVVSAMTEQELKDCDIQMRGTTIIGINYKGNLFKDSYCFMTFSLETLSNNFKVEEGKLTTLEINGEEISSSQLCFYKPYLSFNDFMNLQENEPAFWDKYIEYCQRDCIALYQIWNKFTECVNTLISSINPYLLRSCPLMSSSTIGSHSKKILNALNASNEKYPFMGKDKRKMDMFLKDIENKNIDMEKYKFITRFKRGGISHCHKPGLHTHGITSVDIASQYPASLIQSRIPVGMSRWVNTFEEDACGFYHLKNLKFNTKYDLKPIAKLKASGVLDWNTGNNVEDIFIDSYTIDYLQKHYGLESFDVDVGLVSNEDMDGHKLFGKYVDTFYKEKKNQDALKKSQDPSYNPALRETIKLYLNSLTGKLVEDPERHYSLKFAEENTTPDKLINGVGVNKQFNTEKINDWIIAGVMVYSYSKRLLFEYIRCLPDDSNSVIHIETDGIYFDTRDKEVFDKNLRAYNGEYVAIKYGDDLGNVKIEKSTCEGQKAYFLGKKFYCITDTKENTYKIKGIPKYTIDDAGNKVCLVDENLYETVYSGEKVLKRFNTLKRDLFSKNTKISAFEAHRTINPNCKYIEWK